MGISSQWDGSVPLSNSPSWGLQYWTCVRYCPARLLNKHKSTLWPHCRNQTPTNTSQQPKPFWATQHKLQVSNPWHGTSLRNLLLGPVIPCLPDYLKIKRNQHLSNLSQAWANHSQAAAITGPKRFQTDLLHILFNNHHFFKDIFFFSHSSQAHFADRQKVNLRPVFCESLTPTITMNTIM